MISSLRGPAVHVETGTVIVEIGGVGLSVSVPTALAQATRVGDELHLHTSLIVREDALTLYGFASREELAAFTLLLGVSGVGPRSAIGVLSALTVDQLADAVANEDEKPFRKVSGIGPKTAKLILVSLAGKLIASPTSAPRAVDAPPSTNAVVTAALMGLGWPERTASEAIAKASATASEAELASVPTLLRLSLAVLGPARASGARA